MNSFFGLSGAKVVVSFVVMNNHFLYFMGKSLLFAFVLLANGGVKAVCMVAEGLFLPKKQRKFMDVLYLCHRNATVFMVDASV